MVLVVVSVLVQVRINNNININIHICICIHINVNASAGANTSTNVNINTHISINMNTNMNINIISSRIPAARPQGSLFAVSVFLRFYVRKVHSPSEEEDHENTIREDKDCIRTWFHFPGVLQ